MFTFLIISRNFLQINWVVFAYEKWIYSLSLLFHRIWQIMLLFSQLYFISLRSTLRLSLYLVNYRLLLLECTGVCVLLVFHQLNFVLLTNLSLWHVLAWLPELVFDFLFAGLWEPISGNCESLHTVQKTKTTTTIVIRQTFDVTCCKSASYTHHQSQHRVL